MESIHESSTLRAAAAAALPYLPFVLFFYYIFSCIKDWHRLRGFKGPWYASFSRLWMAIASQTGRQWELYEEANQKYGSFARIGPNELLTDDPEVIRHMSSARTNWKRSEWYDSMSLDPYCDNALNVRDNVKHDRLKSQLSAGYAGKENPNLESDIDSQILSFVSLIRRKYVSEGSTLRRLDLGKVAQYFTLDVITKLAYGYPFGYLEKDEDIHEYIRTTEEAVPYLHLFANFPAFQRFVNKGWVRSILGPKETDKVGLGKLMGVAKEVVAERYGPDAKDRRDMLGAFVRHGISARQAQSEVLLQIIAGSDTTATAIRSTLLRLMTTPTALSKLRAELSSALIEGRLSRPVVTSAEARTLPYLQAVIKEGLRIHPPFTGLLMKEVPAGGDVVKGRFLPAGTKVGHSIWAAQRNKVFGPDPDVFRPERWLEADEATTVQMERTVELVFGYGRYICLGKSIAAMELNKIFVELLLAFDFSLLNINKPWRSVNYGLWMQDELYVRVTERKENETEA